MDGKRKRVTVYGKLREVVKAKERGQDFTIRRRTVAEWLTEWLDQVKATDGTRPQTVRWYRWLVDKHVSPVIGSVKLDRLTPADVRHLLAELVRADVGNTTVRQAHGLLRNALGDAERLELVPRNVARSVRPPASTKGRVRALTPEEARRLLATAKDERLYGLLVLAVTTGLRRGELLALRWQDVSLDEGVLRVRRTLLRLDGRLVFGEPKSASSVRTVPVPPAARDVLRAHRLLIQAESSAASWQDFGLVFPSRIGTPIEPTNVNRWFRELRERAGLSWLRLHDLRHAFATFMLHQGADLRLIMETLGHSQISVTADLYTHVLLPRQRAASEAVDTLILGHEDSDDESAESR